MQLIFKTLTTQKQGTQPPGRQGRGIPRFFFLLPFSKNSDLRFKFFKDMDSESTWEKETRTQWVLTVRTWKQCVAFRDAWNCIFFTPNCYTTQQMELILCATIPASATAVLTQHSNSNPRLLRLCVPGTEIGVSINSVTFLLVCACSLPWFLMVGGSLRPPPLTPFAATSCGEARHTEHSLEKRWAERPRQRAIFNQDSSPPEWFRVTYNELVGGRGQRFFGAAGGEIQVGADGVGVGRT